MYLNHFGLKKPPFRITPDAGFFFAGANRGATLEALQYAILHEEGIVKVSGEVGSGKTMLCRMLMERLPASAAEIIYLANPSLSRDEILIAIADEMGVGASHAPPLGSRLLKALYERLIVLYGQGRRVVVLIDEAHAMPRETLEEIRLLSNLESSQSKLLQLVLFGQPELDALLDAPEMRPLRERITHSIRLEPLARADVEVYIEFRLRAAGCRGPNPFSRAALRLIAEASLGLTRRINILCDKALMAAFAADTHAVTPREARRAIADSGFAGAPGRIGRMALAGSGVAAGLVAAAIAWFWWSGSFDRAVAPVAPGAPPAASRVQPAGGGAVSASPPQAAPQAAAPSVGSVVPVVSAAPASVAGNTAAATAPRGSAGEAQQESAASRAAGAPVAASEAAMQKGEASGPPPARRDGKLVQERFSATQSWLKQAPLQHYSIQLMAAKHSELPRMEEFLQHASRLLGEDSLYVYSVQINGEQYYRAAYGSYAGLGQARQAIQDLPAFFRRQQPFPRSIERMRTYNEQ
jgi:type II secretory pathway predicted ATPase ExeA/septal ring-binding cell division protein DamX